MGLTIHWEFNIEGQSPDRAQEKLNKLRQRASLLPFAYVADKIEECWHGHCDQCEPEEDGLRWIKVLGHRYKKAGNSYVSIPPEHMFAFVTSPGAGCEPAVFGLARYPGVINAEGIPMPTGLLGWSWKGFCKTQYASNPAEGGIENFLNSHIAVIELLDAARELGILTRVTDEGDYWKKRDRQALARTVERWNHLAARVAGHWKDCGKQVRAPITEYPNFEHLEAEDPGQQT